MTWRVIIEYFRSIFSNRDVPSKVDIFVLVLTFHNFITKRVEVRVLQEDRLSRDMYFDAEIMLYMVVKLGHAPFVLPMSAIFGNSQERGLKMTLFMM